MVLNVSARQLVFHLLLLVLNLACGVSGLIADYQNIWRAVIGLNLVLAGMLLGQLPLKVMSWSWGREVARERRRYYDYGE